MRSVCDIRKPGLVRMYPLGKHVASRVAAALIGSIRGETRWSLAPLSVRAASPGYRQATGTNNCGVVDKNHAGLISLRTGALPATATNKADASAICTHRLSLLRVKSPSDRSDQP